MDVCGVSGGDDSTCSRRSGEASAYAVGDPHYRTWDGATFDIQPSTYWGEYVLFQHKRQSSGDIEVQAATVPWFHDSNREGDARGHGGPKGNTGLAISAWGNVVVFYARNGLNNYFIDGNSVSWPNSGMTKIAPGISAAKSGSGFTFVIDNGQGYLRLWGGLVGSNNMDIYGAIGGSWSTGKSVTGAWGDWNGDAGNDQGIVNNLNSKGRLSVLGTPRSYFKDKKPRANSNGQFMLAFDMELDESLNRVIPGEMMTLEIEEPEKQCPDKAAVIAANCKGVFGGALKSCGGDICYNQDPKKAGIEAHKDQVIDKKKNLLDKEPEAGQSPSTTDTCVSLNGVKELSDLPQLAGGKSFSFATWIKREGGKMKGIIAKRGQQWSLESNSDGDITFTSNGASCTTKGKVISRNWAHITAVASATDSKIRIFVDGKQACDAAVTADFAEPSDGSVQIGSINDQSDAKIGRAFYVASGVRANEVAIFSSRTVNCRS